MSYIFFMNSATLPSNLYINIIRVHVKLYVCKFSHDTGDNSSVKFPIYPKLFETLFTREPEPQTITSHCASLPQSNSFWSPCNLLLKINN